MVGDDLLEEHGTARPPEGLTEQPQAALQGIESEASVASPRIPFSIPIPEPELRKEGGSASTDIGSLPQSSEAPQQDFTVCVLHACRCC